MKHVTILVSAVAILGSLTGLSFRSARGGDPLGVKIRVGTYDNRAIAIAFAHSKSSPMAERQREMDKAKAAGDEAKMKELKAWGVEYQRQLHFQGFGRVPVDELLEPIKEQLARLARDKQLAAIAMSCDFTSEQVEVVDITDDIVKLYDPPEKALKHVREIRKVKPIELTKLADLPADH